MKGLLIIAAALTLLIIACGGGTNGGDIQSGTPNPNTSGCAYGTAALQIEGGDIESARLTFNELLNHPDAQDIDTPKHALQMLGVDPNTTAQDWAYSTKPYMDNGWQAGVHLNTEFGHWLYISAMYPTDETGDRWHLECVETSRHNFGTIISIDIEVVMVTRDDGTEDEVEKVVSGGPYLGVEVTQYFLIKG